MAFAGVSPEDVQRYMKLPGVKPPPGIIPNYENPQNTLFVANTVVNVLCVTISTLFVGIRMYTRHFVMKNLWWDDLFSVLAWLVLIVQCAVGWTLVNKGAGFHGWDLHYYNIVEMLYWTVPAKALYICCISFIKISILLQILRIFVPHRGINKALYWTATGLIVVISLFYTVEFFFAVIQCSPHARQWNRKIPGKCIGSSNIVWTAGFNVITDVAILILPLASIWRLQMSYKNKIGVSLIFSTGIIAVVTSALRLYYSWLVIRTIDFAYVTVALQFCLLAEVLAGIMVGCMPTLPRFGTEMKSSWASTRSRMLNSRSASGKAMIHSGYGGSSDKARGDSQKELRSDNIQLGGGYEELDDAHLGQP